MVYGSFYLHGPLGTETGEAGVSGKDLCYGLLHWEWLALHLSLLKEPISRVRTRGFFTFFLGGSVIHRVHLNAWMAKSSIFPDEACLAVKRLFLPLSNHWRVSIGSRGGSTSQHTILTSLALPGGPGPAVSQPALGFMVAQALMSDHADHAAMLSKGTYYF